MKDNLMTALIVLAFACLAFLIIPRFAHSQTVQPLAATGPFFLYSDPWPASVGQPDTCVAVEGASQIPLTLITAAPGSKQIKHDLTGVSGAHTWSITCSNAFGPQVGGPVDFPFVVGPPTKPVQLRIAP